MPDSKPRVVRFTCPDCGQPVTYRRRSVLGMAGYDDEPRAAKTVYLTCALNHTHPYQVDE